MATVSAVEPRVTDAHRAAGNRRKRFLVMAALLLALVPSARLAWISRDMPHLGQYHDDGLYWVCAKSLAFGSGYRILSLPGQPYQTKYPPLYPALLAAIWRIHPAFPANLPLATLFSWLMLPLYVMLARIAFRDLGLGHTASWALCAVMALNPAVAFFSISLMPELAFSCLLLASLILGRRAGQEDKAHGNWVALAAGLLGASAYLTRSAAAPLLVACPLWFLLRKQYARASLYFAAMVPAVFGWTLWVRGHLHASSDVVALYYTNYLGYQQYNVPWRDLSLFVENNLYFLLTGISKLFVYDTGGGFWSGWFWRLFAFAAIAGVARLARGKGASQYHWYAAGFVPLLILWHFPPDERLTLPVYPLLLAGLAVELGHLTEMLREAFQRSPLAGKAFAGLLGAGIAAFVCLAAYFSFVGLFQFLPGIVEQHRSLLASERDAYRWIEQNTPQDAAFLSYDDPVLYLYTGRRGSSIPVPPRVFYEEGASGVFRLFEDLVGFARRHQLQGMLVTVADFYRGELSSEQREALQRNIARNPAFLRAYESPMSQVYLIEPRLTPPRQP